MLDMDLQGLFVWLPLTGLARLFQHDLLMRVAGLRDYIAQTSVVEVLQQLPLSSFGKKDYYEQEKSLGSTPETCTADFRNGPTCTDVGRNGTVSDKAFRNNLLTQKDECQDRCPESTSTVGASGGLGNLSKGTWPLRSDSKAFNCWYAPDGSDFRIRGKSYLRDKKKVTAGKPFGELIAVDWFVDYKRIDNIASRPGGTCQRALQRASGKHFIFAVNIQVPGVKHFSIVFYYLLPGPVHKDSVLGKFIDGDDAYKNARFKLIPNIAVVNGRPFLIPLSTTQGICQASINCYLVCKLRDHGLCSVP